MPITLDGTNGLSDVDGSASTPAIRGTDTNTGIFFPAADTIAFSEGGVESMRITSDGNVNIKSTAQNGTTSSLYVKQTTDTGFKGLTVVSAATEEFAGSISMISGGILNIAQSYLGGTGSYQPISFSTQGAERMRLNTGGALLIGTTATSPATADAYGVTINSNTSGNFYQGIIQASSNGSASLLLNRGSDNGNIALFYRSAANVGNIAVTGSATSYNSGSDYRLKNDIQPLTNALQKVALLKPSKWSWKVDDTYGDGFVAHELAEVCPHAVTGEKDAMETYTDNNGNEQTRIKPQSVDTSFLVATLTAAIQELKAIVDAQAIEIAELKAGN